MKRAVVVLSAIACCDCQGVRTDAPRRSEAPARTKAFTDRAWAGADSSGLPGALRIFLGDGTLVMDSCWETYQLAKWRAESDSVVVWQEGAAEVRGRILELSDDHLVLRLALVDGSRDEHYRLAPVPYLCPDMPR
jgi:hypothetical protein